MLETRITIIMGGHDICRASWRKEKGEVLDSHKLYIPTNGSANVWVDEHLTRILPGKVYFIPGRRRVRYGGAREFELDWLHFRPLSPALDYALSRFDTVMQWPATRWSYWNHTIRSISASFRERHTTVDLRLEAMLLDICATLVEPNPNGYDHRWTSNPEIERLLPALQFMDKNFTLNPALDEIARQVHLSPAHFHRVFRLLFDVTPQGYMERQRMALVHRLLTQTGLTVGQVADMAGYSNPYYFSRAVRRFFGHTPRAIRQGGRGAKIMA